MRSVEEAPSAGARRIFTLVFAQPLDHMRPELGDFDQHMTLVHQSLDAPMVLTSTGYHNYLGANLSEPAQLFAGNQLSVEHRFFGNSRPSDLDWAHLDIVQAAADHHRIITALTSIYRGPWISTGVSKGGMTSVFHRRFYPDDVAATIAYVAPISFDTSDRRYHAYLADVGDATCRQAVRTLQREVLLRRPQMEALARSRAQTRGQSFTRIGGIGPALEAALIEFEFAYWQYLGLRACDDIPDASVDDDEVFAFFDSLGSIGQMSNRDIETYEPYFYQSFTEIGYPSVPTEHIDDLIQYDYRASLATMTPAGVSLPAFRTDAMEDIAAWVTNESERIIWIYGENDPWTAGAVNLGQERDAHVFFAPSQGHQANIADLAPIDINALQQALARWTGVDFPDSMSARSQQPALSPQTTQAQDPIGIGIRP